MAVYEIKKLQDLLGSEIVSVSTTNLTSAGDNYASAIFSVAVTIKDGQKEKQIRAVAKMIPQNELIRKLFNSERTFRNEVAYYEKIAPCLTNFQKEHNLPDLFSSYPEFYGARTSLDPSKDTIDNDAILLIQNIKETGFCTLDRKIGFDLDQTKLILDKMAELHATAIALKTQKLQVFERDLRRFFAKFNMFEAEDDENQKLIDSIVDLLQEDEFCVRNMKTIRARLEFSSGVTKTKNHEEFQKTPFASIVHCDLWSNNIMIKIVDDKAVDVKFVDYQMYEYSSLVRDVVFFLFTSVQLPVVQTNLDGLLVFYFERFGDWLKKLGCDTSIFKFEEFLEEMGSFVKWGEFYHIMLMLKPIYTLDKDAKDVDSLKQDDFMNSGGELAEGRKPRAYFIVKELIRRGWL